jgi:hypothetical protein
LIFVEKYAILVKKEAFTMGKKNDKKIRLQNYVALLFFVAIGFISFY